MKVFRKLLRNFNQEGPNNEQKSNDDTRHSIYHYQKKNDSDLDVGVKLSKLHLAVLSERESEVKKYLTIRNMNEVDGLKRTALHLAVLQNNPNLVRLLLSHGASTEICDKGGFTPLLRAVEIGNIDLVEIFWNRKLNDTQTDFSGNTPLHLAVTYGFYKIVNLLVKDGSLVNVPNEVGHYPLHMATQNESYSIAKILLENHALVDVEDKMKRTPLLIAINIGNLSLVELLLNYKANPDLCDANGVCIKEYALSTKNSKIRALIFGDQTKATNYETKKAIQINDEDSQASEQSCVLPPVLEAPRSWNVLHPCDRTQGNKKPYRKRVKSLSLDFPENTLRNEPLSYTDRRKSISFFQLADQHSESSKLAIFSKEDENSRYESCRKVLDELSLDKLHGPARLKSEDEEIGNLKFNLNLKLKSDLTSNKLSVSDESSAHETVRNKCDRKRKTFCKNFAEKYDDFSDSSDEKPPFWKNSLDGGYFTADPSYETRKRPAIAAYSSSSSEENSDDASKNVKLDNPMLNRLKQVTQENQDLETETAVLRDAVEKLKYDLANFRLHSDVNETNVIQFKVQMTQLESKYLKANHKINLLELTMNNMQQEISYLKYVCDKFLKINQQLMAEKKGSLGCGKRLSTELESAVSVDQNVVHKLQADILYWKTKENAHGTVRYEEVTNQDRERHNTANFNMQHLVTLNVELNRLDSKIKDCLSKADFTELQNKHEILAGKMMQQVLEEANRKLQSSIAEIKSDIEWKLHENESSQNEQLRETENEYMKEKLLSEISKLSAFLKGKESNEQRLKNQLIDSRNELEKLKTEKRKWLTKKAYENHSSLQIIEADLQDLDCNSSNYGPEGARSFSE